MQSLSRPVHHESSADQPDRQLDFRKRIPRTLTQVSPRLAVRCRSPVNTAVVNGGDASPATAPHTMDDNQGAAGNDGAAAAGNGAAAAIVPDNGAGRGHGGARRGAGRTAGGGVFPAKKGKIMTVYRQRRNTIMTRVHELYVATGAVACLTIVSPNGKIEATCAGGLDPHEFTRVLCKERLAGHYQRRADVAREDPLVISDFLSRRRLWVDFDETRDLLVKCGMDASKASDLQ